MKFFVTCLILASLCVGAVFVVSSLVNKGEAAQKKDDKSETTKGTSDVPELRRANEPTDDKPVQIVRVAGGQASNQPMVVSGARVMTVEVQEVPSEKDGKLLFLATPVGEHEEVPADRLDVREFPILGTQISSAEWQKLPADQRLSPVQTQSDMGRVETRYYRKAKVNDSMDPGTTKIFNVKLRLRKLREGDLVKSNQILGVINPALALNELGIKQAKVEASAADVLATVAMKEESTRRLSAADRLRIAVKSGISDDDYGVLRVTVDKYKSEEVAKKAAVEQSKQELSGALTMLEMHLLRSSIAGRIKTVYKQNGEAVKNLESVLQIQNPWKLKAQAQLDVQDAEPLRQRLAKAEAYRKEARQRLENARAKGLTGGDKTAEELLALADKEVAVEIEASQPTPPKAILQGHMLDVTCVAVTKGTLPRIASGSLDGTVRLWERIPGTNRWEERHRLDHNRIAVKAVACTGVKSKQNLLLTGTASGQGRIFNLDRLGEKDCILNLKSRHSGSIEAVTFNTKGTLCATAGEDRVIRVWNTSTGELVTSRSAAHRAVITSLVFSAKDQLLSASRDKTLVVWSIEEKDDRVALVEAERFAGRSGEVAELGVDPTGTRVLFDEGRELRVLSLGTGKIEGSISNQGASSLFSTMAFFSPDGHTTLTNGNGPGKLQLWRTPSPDVRPAELRQYLWSSGTALCGAFAPESPIVVTGTSDHRVLVWELPDKAESEKPLAGQLSYVESFLDTSLQRVTIRATFDNPKQTSNPDEGVIIPGGSATIVVQPQRK